MSGGGWVSDEVYWWAGRTSEAGAPCSHWSEDLVKVAVESSSWGEGLGDLESGTAPGEVSCSRPRRAAAGSSVSSAPEHVFVEELEAWCGLGGCGVVLSPPHIALREPSTDCNQRYSASLRT